MTGLLGTLEYVVVRLGNVEKKELVLQNHGV